MRTWRDLQSGTEFHNWLNIFLAHFLSNKEQVCFWNCLAVCAFVSIATSEPADLFS